MNERQEELRRVSDLVQRILVFIEQDRDVVLREIERRKAEDAARPEPHVLPDWSARTAQVYWEVWQRMNEENPGIRDVTGAELQVGFCVHETHSWFRIFADPQKACEPRVIYLVDPAPRGVVTGASGMVILPGSPFHLSYRAHRM